MSKPTNIQVLESVTTTARTLTTWLADTSQKYSEVCDKVAGGIVRSTPFCSISPQPTVGEEIPGKITLVTQFFMSYDAKRLEELQTSLKVNTANPQFDEILLINEREYSQEELGCPDCSKIRQIVTGKRLDFKTVFDVVRSEKLDGYIVLSNLDIFFDKGIGIIRKTGLSETKAIFALLRYEFNKGKKVSESQLFKHQGNSQDTWIWHSNYTPSAEDSVVFEYQLGIPGCDNTFIYAAHLLGYIVYNTPSLIKSYHHHATNVRTSNAQTKRTVMPYASVYAPLRDEDIPDDSHPFTFYGENKNFYEYLSEAVDSGVPFVVPRLAGIEHMYAMLGAHAAQRGKFQDNEAEFVNKMRGVMKNNAGIFLPDANSVVTYAESYLDAFTRCELYLDWEPQGDVASAYGHGLQTAYEFIQANMTRKRVWAFASADIFHVVRQEVPWTHALKGKRILIISPFAETLKKQIPVLDKIYGRDLFPECIFTFLVPPVTNGKNKSLPFDQELDEFTRQIGERKGEFDIALVSCGGYGNPIVANIHKMGRSAIYIGGALQMFFGVYGARWERERPLVLRLFKNEHWTRPSEEERPKGFENVEGACYW